MSSWSNRILAVIFAACVCLIACPAAFAADTYRPTQFDPNKHVYVDPLSANHRTLPVTFPGLEEKLKEAGKSNGISIYVVFAEQGDDADPSTNMALPVLIKIRDSWWDQPGFDRDNHLLIVHVRKKGTKYAGKTAAECGPALKAMGLTKDRFNSSSGPVMRAVSEHMKVSNPDHERFIMAIIAHVNEDIGNYKESHRQGSGSGSGSGSGARSQPMSSETQRGILVMFAIVVSIAVLIVVVIKAAENERSAKLATHEKVNKLMSELEQCDLDLKALGTELPPGARPGETHSYSGKTAAEVNALRAGYADQCLAHELWKAQLAKARNRIDDWWGSSAARALLSIEQVTIGGVSFEAGQTYVPGKQVAASQLHDRVTTSIVGLRTTAQQLKDKLTKASEAVGTIGWLKRARDQYCEQKLNFAPFAAEDAALNRSLPTVFGTLASDPISGLEEYEPLSERVESLKNQLVEGVRANGLLPAVESGITLLRKISELRRAGKVTLCYPGKLVGDVDVSVRSEPELLSESGCNPDGSIERATKLLRLSRTALAEARTIEAAKLAVDAIAECQEGQTGIELADYCKRALEKTSDAGSEPEYVVPAAGARLEATYLGEFAPWKYTVPHVESRLNALPGEFTSDDVTLAQASEEFAFESFADLGEEKEKAVAKTSQSRGLLSMCARAYMGQKFLTSARYLGQAGSLIDEAVGYRKLVSNRVAELGMFKERALTTGATLPALCEQLRADPPKGTTEDTVKARQALLAQANGLASRLNEERVNWRNEAASAEALDADLVALGGKMKADADKYAEAQKKIDDAVSRGWSASEADKARAQADVGNFTASDALVVAYLCTLSSRSSSSGSSCSSSSGSSCSSSSCGGGGCGGGGCGGGCGGG
jgi:uncharacterized membrane protein YgcG